MSLKQLMQRGPASPPLHPRVAEHYLTSYGRDFQSPAGTKAQQCNGAAGFPTPHTKEWTCLPGATDHSLQQHRTGDDHVLSRLRSSPPSGPTIAPPCGEGRDICMSRLADSKENPRRCETTYGDEFNGLNSVRNPVAEHHQCTSPKSSTAAPLCATLKFYSHTARPIKSQKETTLCGSSEEEGKTFAGINTFKTTYSEKFNDASSIRALVPTTSCTDTRLITAPICGPPYGGVSEKPPPYVPGAEFTYPAEKPIIRYVNKSTTHDAYQHRTRNHNVVSYDTGGDAVCRANPATAQPGFSSTVKTASDLNGVRSSDIGTSRSEKSEVETASQFFSGTNPSATAPRQYRLYEALQAVDRRHDSFALASNIEQERRKIKEVEAAATLPSQTPSTKPSLHDMFEESQKYHPPRDKCGVAGETCGIYYGDVCPFYGEVPNAGLDAFHESVNKFVPIKSTTSTKTPYCKPWEPLTKVVHVDAERQNFDFTPSPIAASDGFIPVCPAARHDGRVTGRKRNDWKPEGCALEA